jgi:CDP-glucose 4,6-dehydratase
MSFWDQRRVFVTGATGFIGAHVARHLLEAGAEVICLQRDEVRECALDLFDLRRRVTVVHGALEDHPLLARVINEYETEAVFHLAAQALVGAANRSPLSTFDSNIRGTYSLLEACRLSSGVRRVVVASSDKAYGTQAALPYREESPLDGIFPYDASKVCTDVLARSYARSYGLPVSVTRFANVYGPGDLNLSRIVPGAIREVLRDRPPVIRSDGTPVREYIHVDDVARGYLRLAEAIEEARGEAFNFGSGDQISVLELAERIIRLAGREGKLRPQVLRQTKIEGEIDAQYLSSEKAHARLNWRAQIGLDQGLRETIEWYRAHLDAIDPVRG